MRIDKDNIKIILILLVVCLGIGYSYLNTELNINGTANINSANWSVYWNNVQVESGSVSAPTPTIDSDKTTVSYTVTLDKPGDYYGFTVDAVNAGTIDAMIETIDSKLNGVTMEEVPAYLDYGISYSDDTPLEENQELLHDSTETYKVHIGYADYIDADELPTTNQSLSLEFTVTYKQATDDSKQIRTYLYNINAAQSGVFIEANNAWCIIANVDGDILNSCDDSVGFLTEEKCNSFAQQFEGAYCEYGPVTSIDLGTTYATHQDLISATGRQIFLRHRIIDKQIVQSSVGFVYNNSVYYLNSDQYYGEPGENYASNKNLLFSIFGSDNCLIRSETIESVDCINSDIEAYAYEDGRVGATKTEESILYSCNSNIDGSLCSETTENTS